MDSRHACKPRNYVIMKKALLINAGLLAAILVGSAAFDASLTLGDFHGLVFRIFVVYGVIGLAIGNGILIGIIAIRKHLQK